jgi:alkanesulfonate monooxygenase SsuD/methylene tetrahydromethanopterin reductase-like flavin-dependent oxidoreductase (luciferase family)
MHVSVHDQSPALQGAKGAGALRNTLDLARLYDALGNTRSSVAEHHGGPMLASVAPEVVIGAIAAASNGIRVGSGGVTFPATRC